ncbi:hypothetical protein RDWZM_002962 [Blomia tropicalis]|uniref:RING-type domain-containing protein n=1 Tax=Blomia tropicalis TaxID=40697 RepID=A0A9Q0MH86_BLOTA|nr:hypothetical protein RDWZM_002962 [Blomia tropicalis]
MPKTKKSSCLITEEDFHFMKQVLRQFKCPFQDESMGCLYEKQPNKCFFAHPETPNLTIRPIDVPEFICVYNLLKRCNMKSKKVSQLGETVSICPTGFHLTIAEMLDLEYYQAKNCELIAKHYVEDLQHKCAICLEEFLPYRHNHDRSLGLLENCFHCFCAPCIIEWQKKNGGGSINCPICRKSSDNISISTKFINNRFN